MNMGAQFEGYRRALDRLSSTSRTCSALRQGGEREFHVALAAIGSYRDL
jgi:hypothetical protein